MRLELTPRQQSFLIYLEEQISRTGKTPSLRRAAADMNVSHTAISQLIKALEEKRVIMRESRYSRTIHLLNRAEKPSGVTRWVEIPIIGNIAAGLPLYAQQEWDGSLVLDSSVYPGQNLFGLKVNGDSMVGAAILDGDLAICEPRQFAADGEIVVALINHEEATIKRFFLRRNNIELRPENPVYSPMFYSFSEVLVQGRVIGLHRGPEVLNKL